MCFSIQVDKNIKKLTQKFQAGADRAAFVKLQEMRDLTSGVSTQELKELLGPKISSSLFKVPEEDGRIYPNYFAPVITSTQGKRVMRPMRYRVRPFGSREEIPTQFNVFNARVDSLEKRKTWSSLFMRNHGLIPFSSFYEWVRDSSGQRKQINFSPKEQEYMWAPCLWDHWRSQDGRIEFQSFALITDDPPKEIRDMGHDRCPIFLERTRIDDWLNPGSQSKQEIYALLEKKEKASYKYRWVD